MPMHTRANSESIGLCAKLVAIGAVTHDVELNFGNAYDKLLRAADNLELARDLVAGVRDYQQAKIANDQNDVMKRLAVIATVFLPLTFLTGFFGQNVRYFHAFDVNLRGEMRGVAVRVATTTGRQVTDTCELTIDNPSQRNCHTALPFKMSGSLLVSYTIPRVRVQTSGVFRSSPGSMTSSSARGSMPPSPEPSPPTASRRRSVSTSRRAPRSARSRTTTGWCSRCPSLRRTWTWWT